jgi:hypothetical protein
VVVDSLSTMLLRFGAARAFHVLGELRAIFGIDSQPADRSSSSTGAGSTMLARKSSLLFLSPFKYFR